jgi:hypothetical protein
VGQRPSPAGQLPRLAADAVSRTTLARSLITNSRRLVLPMCRDGY